MQSVLAVFPLTKQQDRPPARYFDRKVSKSANIHKSLSDSRKHTMTVVSFDYQVAANSKSHSQQAATIRLGEQKGHNSIRSSKRPKAAASGSRRMRRQSLSFDNDTGSNVTNYQCYTTSSSLLSASALVSSSLSSSTSSYSSSQAQLQSLTGDGGAHFDHHQSIPHLHRSPASASKVKTPKAQHRRRQQPHHHHHQFRNHSQLSLESSSATTKPMISMLNDPSTMQNCPTTGSADSTLARQQPPQHQFNLRTSTASNHGQQHPVATTPAPSSSSGQSLPPPYSAAIAPASASMITMAMAASNQQQHPTSSNSGMPSAAANNQHNVICHQPVPTSGQLMGAQFSTAPTTINNGSLDNQLQTGGSNCFLPSSAIMSPSSATQVLRSQSYQAGTYQLGNLDQSSGSQNGVAFIGNGANNNNFTSFSTQQFPNYLQPHISSASATSSSISPAAASQQNHISTSANNDATNSGYLNSHQFHFHSSASHHHDQHISAAAVIAAATAAAQADNNGSSNGHGSSGILKSKSCLTCADISIKWYIVVIALLGLICALIGTIVGAVHSAGRDYISLALLLIGVGLVLVAISWIALRITISTYRNSRSANVRRSARLQAANLIAQHHLRSAQPPPPNRRSVPNRLLRSARSNGNNGSQSPSAANSNSLHRNALINERIYMMAAAAAAAAAITRHSAAAAAAAAQSQSQEQPDEQSQTSAASGNGFINGIKSRLPRRLIRFFSAGSSQLTFNRSETGAPRIGRSQVPPHPPPLPLSDHPATLATFLRQYQAMLLPPPHQHGLLFPSPLGPPPHLFPGFPFPSGALEFPFRPPPPSYNAAMQDQRLRMLLQERQGLQQQQNTSSSSYPGNSQQLNGGPDEQTTTAPPPTPEASEEREPPATRIIIESSRPASAATMTHNDIYVPSTGAENQNGLPAVDNSSVIVSIDRPEPTTDQSVVAKSEGEQILGYL